MYDYEAMASVVGKKLVENGQTRILQRIYDGVTSNWALDVADDKASINHQLIHLVWRKFPRNQHPSEERRPTAVSSTQTEEGSSPVLGLDSSAGLSRPPRKILEKDCYSSSDLGNLFETKSNSSCSDAGSSSDCFSSELAESELTTHDYSPEDTSFIPSPKRRSGKKLLFIEKKFNPELSNRFDCLEEEVYERSTSSIVKSPPELSYETQSRRSGWSKLRRKGIVKWVNSTTMPYGFLTMGNNVGFFHVKNVHDGEDYTPKPGDEVSFLYDDYDEGAMDVQVLPTLSNFPLTPDEKAEIPKTLTTTSREVPVTSEIPSTSIVSITKIPSSSETLVPSVPLAPSRVSTDTRGTVKSYKEDNSSNESREKGTVTHFEWESGGLIYPDNLEKLGSFGKFDKTHLHSEKELGLKIRDRVTFTCLPISGDACRPDFFQYFLEAKCLERPFLDKVDFLNKSRTIKFLEAKDVRLIDKG